MMSPSLSDASPAPKRIEFEDPHAGIGNLQEAEVTRVRMLRGGWRWALVVATAATILLCINQQFSLRFFIDYTQLNTEYFYLLSVLPFTVYPLFAEASWLGPFRGSQLTLEQATAYHVLSGESLLGIPIQAFADTVIGFLVFGTALMMTGAGKFFINIAFALCGTFRGGAAKVCIFASGLLGMMSGSIISNVLTAGTMTIPVMKKSGFRASYA